MQWCRLNAVHYQSIKIIKRLRNIVSKKHLYLSFMVKRFIIYVPQFSALLIRCIYQLLLNKLLTINEDVLYLNRRCCLMTQIRNSNFKSKKTFNVQDMFQCILGRSQIRSIRRTIVKTTVCQNGGASLLLIDKNV